MPRTKVTKRVADDVGGNAARASKTPRTEKNGDGSKKVGNKAPKPAAHSSADFKAKALPLHLSLTHTPPAIEKHVEGEESGDKPEDSSLAGDPGFIGNLTLVPSVFSTGSYGWKGNKRIAIELQLGDTDSDGVNEKVQVMLTVNATVIGSKNATTFEGKKGREEGETDEGPVEHSESEQ